MDKFKSEIQSCRDEIIRQLQRSYINVSSLQNSVNMLLELTIVENDVISLEEDLLTAKTSGEIEYLVFQFNRYLDGSKGYVLCFIRSLWRNLCLCKKYTLPNNIQVEWKDSLIPMGVIRCTLNPYAMYNELLQFSFEKLGMPDYSRDDCVATDLIGQSVFVCNGKTFEIDVNSSQIIHSFENTGNISYMCFDSNYFYVLVKYGSVTIINKHNRSTGEVVTSSFEKRNDCFGLALGFRRLLIGKLTSFCIYSEELEKEGEVELRISHRIKKNPNIRDIHTYNDEVYVLLYGTGYPLQVFDTDGHCLRVLNVLCPEIDLFYFAIDFYGNIIFNHFVEKRIKIYNRRGRMIHTIEYPPYYYKPRSSNYYISVLNSIILFTNDAPYISYV